MLPACEPQAILSPLKNSLDIKSEEELLRDALNSRHSIRDEINAACTKLARDRKRLGTIKDEEPIWRLLNDEAFQTNFAEWVMAGGIDEGKAIKERLVHTMEKALAKFGAGQDKITDTRTDYFDALEKTILTHPVIARWRHQLGLTYLREQVTHLQSRAEEAAGIYSSRKQSDVLDKYCNKALKTWDIIDLSNLPEGDIHMATQKILLRRLYLPLHIEVATNYNEGDRNTATTDFEQLREIRRRREAGHQYFDVSYHLPPPTAFRIPIGEQLNKKRRLVVLGDPGGGKTTMLRWMATAYLLRYKGDISFSRVHDTDTLPDYNWIPVLIRCRDLGEADLCRCFPDFLTQHLQKTELLPEEADVMRTVILNRVAKGEVLLLIDGLDEISNPRVRMMFCRELERTAARYPKAPFVVTSRIVGYKDMPYRIESEFGLSIISDLDSDDKALFANRWVDVTEQHHSTEIKEERTRELLDALHSNDRIQRLTGNPMLLTTLALVKRKIGKLPNRRSKLYAETVSVLLNWNPRFYESIDEDEAIPQIGYIAYEMCRRGVQRLTDDDVLDLLEKFRAEYPNIRAIRRREPQDFLKLLEARSGILMKSGDIVQKNKGLEKAVWEFRHLTFQEYLAARALLDGRYPDRDKTRSLAEQVAPLAGTIERIKHQRPANHLKKENVVSESWRETLRLLVADCKDDDVDEVLGAILNPLPGEDSSTTSRARAVLAGMCLSDEPNISEEMASRIISEFVNNVEESDGTGSRGTSLDRAAMAIMGSMWLHLLKESIVNRFSIISSDTRWDLGALWGTLEETTLSNSILDSEAILTKLISRLRSNSQVEQISATLTVMTMAYNWTINVNEDLIDSLLALLSSEDPALITTSAWALAWLSGGHSNPITPIWVAGGDDMNQILMALEIASPNDTDLQYWLIIVLGASRNSRALPSLLQLIDTPVDWFRKNVIEALGRLGNKKAVTPLMKKLEDRNPSIRKAAIEALGLLGDNKAVNPILEKLEDPDPSIRRIAIEALGLIGNKKAVTQLMKQLKDPKLSIRKAAIEALGRVGDKKAVPLLMENLEDHDPSIRKAAIEALGGLGDKKAVVHLIKILTMPEPPSSHIHRAAIKALGKLKDKLAVMPLAYKLNDPDEAVFSETAMALVQLGDKQAIQPLLHKLNAPNPHIRMIVIFALGKLGNRQSLQPLLEKLEESNKYFQMSATKGQERQHNKLTARQIKRLDEREAFVRTTTIEALGRLGDKQAIPPLALLLEDPDHHVATAAAASLKALGDAHGSNALINFFNHTNPKVRKGAVEKLAFMRNNDMETKLLSFYLDGMESWLDPITPITEMRVALAAQRLGITKQEVRSFYKSIAGTFHLKLELD